MGQKTHPKGFRLGITENWDSRWFSKQDYARNLHQDFRIREFIREKLQHAGVPRVEIERSGNKVKVNIYTCTQNNVPQTSLGQVTTQTVGGIAGTYSFTLQTCRSTGRVGRRGICRRADGGSLGSRPAGDPSG